MGKKVLCKISSLQFSKSVVVQLGKDRNLTRKKLFKIIQKGKENSGDDKVIEISSDSNSDCKIDQILKSEDKSKESFAERYKKTSDKIIASGIIDEEENINTIVNEDQKLKNQNWALNHPKHNSTIDLSMLKIDLSNLNSQSSSSSSKKTSSVRYLSLKNLIKYVHDENSRCRDKIKTNHFYTQKKSQLCQNYKSKAQNVYVNEIKNQINVRERAGYDKCGSGSYKILNEKAKVSVISLKNRYDRTDLADGTTYSMTMDEIVHYLRETVWHSEFMLLITPAGKRNIRSSSNESVESVECIQIHGIDKVYVRHLGYIIIPKTEIQKLTERDLLIFKQYTTIITTQAFNIGIELPIIMSSIKYYLTASDFPIVSDLSCVSSDERSINLPEQLIDKVNLMGFDPSQLSSSIVPLDEMDSNYSNSRSVAGQIGLINGLSREQVLINHKEDRTREKTTEWDTEVRKRSKSKRKDKSKSKDESIKSGNSLRKKRIEKCLEDNEMEEMQSVSCKNLDSKSTNEPEQFDYRKCRQREEPEKSVLRSGQETVRRLQSERSDPLSKQELEKLKQFDYRKYRQREEPEKIVLRSGQETIRRLESGRADPSSKRELEKLWKHMEWDRKDEQMQTSRKSIISKSTGVRHESREHRAYKKRLENEAAFGNIFRENNKDSNRFRFAKNSGDCRNVFYDKKKLSPNSVYEIFNKGHFMEGNLNECDYDELFHYVDTHNFTVYIHPNYFKRADHSYQLEFFTKTKKYIGRLTMTECEILKQIARNRKIKPNLIFIYDLLEIILPADIVKVFNYITQNFGLAYIYDYIVMAFFDIYKQIFF